MGENGRPARRSRRPSPRPGHRLRWKQSVTLSALGILRGLRGVKPLRYLECAD